MRAVAPPAAACRCPGQSGHPLHPRTQTTRSGDPGAAGNRSRDAAINGPRSPRTSFVRWGNGSPACGKGSGTARSSSENCRSRGRFWGSGNAAVIRGFAPHSPSMQAKIVGTPVPRPLRPRSPSCPERLGGLRDPTLAQTDTLGAILSVHHSITDFHPTASPIWGIAFTFPQQNTRRNRSDLPPGSAHAWAVRVYAANSKVKPMLSFRGNLEAPRAERAPATGNRSHDRSDQRERQSRMRDGRSHRLS